MEKSLYQANYNPDVLSCIANLSSDEVFTPPELANKMLDMLPQELFQNPDTKFLDPCCKSGVFLREITKRLIDGLESQIPNIHNRIEHILTKQVFGIAITELTSLLSRRSVYCSKYPSSQFSIYTFPEEQPQGMIVFQKTKHTWKDKKCIYCGASQSEYDRNPDLETHAYQFIHNFDVKKIFNMKFDVIIGNPPYQLSDGGGLQTESSSGSAIPLYQKFISQAKKLKPRYLSMIIPARWYSGGRGLDKFREEMLSDSHIVRLVDYTDSRECFPGVDIAGGVCYFLWDRDRSDDCITTNIYNGKEYTQPRKLDEFPVFIRYSLALDIVHKVLALKEKMFSEIVFSSKPFGFRSFETGLKKPKPDMDMIALFGSKGISYVNREDVNTNSELIGDWKVIMSKTSAEHAGQADKDGRKKILSRIEILPPDTICSESYLLVYVAKNKSEAENVVTYMKTQLFRYLMSTVLLTQNIAKDKFCFIPVQNFEQPVSDEMLYEKYNISPEEVDFINSMIRPME